MNKLTLYGCIVCPFTAKVRFALNLLNIDYNYEEIDILTSKNREESYLKVNPQGRVPSLVTSDGNNLYDSQVLLSYIEDEFGGLFPKSNFDKATQRIWIGFFDNNVFSKYHPMISAVQAKNNEQIEKIHKEAIESLKQFSNGSGITQRISQNTTGFFNGEKPSYADVAIASHLKIMIIFWKNFLNRDLLDSNEGADIQAIKQLIENIYSTKSCLDATISIPVLPPKGKNPLLDDLGFTSTEKYDFEQYIVHFLQKKFFS